MSPYRLSPMVHLVSHVEGYPTPFAWLISWTPQRPESNLGSNSQLKCYLEQVTEYI